MEGAGEGEVEGVIEDAVEGGLVGAGVGGVAVEDFAEAVDACGGVEAGPEGLLNVFDRVDAEAVDAEGGDEVLDP